MPPPHLMTLADLSPAQIRRIITHAHYLKQVSLPWLAPQQRLSSQGQQTTDSDSTNTTTKNFSKSKKSKSKIDSINNNRSQLRLPSQSLFSKSIALLFSKRSTRTRVSAETAAVLLGGRALFLGSEDIQLGVNESVRDSARVIGGMCQGIFARVGEHEEIEVWYFPPFF